MSVTSCVTRFFFWWHHVTSSGKVNHSPWLVRKDIVWQKKLNLVELQQKMCFIMIIITMMVRKKFKLSWWNTFSRNLTVQNWWLRVRFECKNYFLLSLLGNRTNLDVHFGTRHFGQLFLILGKRKEKKYASVFRIYRYLTSSILRPRETFCSVNTQSKPNHVIAKTEPDWFSFNCEMDR